MLRITSGLLRGRTFPVPGTGVRPTHESVREAIYNALGPLAAEARVLDLYGGSGALGLEAWSRGAAEVWWVEQSGRIFRTLKANVSALCTDPDRPAKCVRSDVRSFLKTYAGPPFDLVLADPPYARPGETDLAAATMAALGSSPAVHPETVVVMEQARRQADPAAPPWEMLRDKNYGDTRVLFYRLQ